MSTLRVTAGYALGLMILAFGVFVIARGASAMKNHYLVTRSSKPLTGRRADMAGAVLLGYGLFIVILAGLVVWIILTEEGAT
jgi:hypothetical protein